MVLRVMKSIVIEVVSLGAWLLLIVFAGGGYYLGAPLGLGLLGALIGFVVGCFGPALWFLLVSIHEKLTVIAKTAAQVSELLASKQGQAVQDTKADKLEPILPTEVNPSSWLDVISGQGEKR
jgi:hypothetical protein